MELDDALELLCRIHLRDLESERPAVINVQPDTLSGQDYLSAWTAVREHVLETRAEIERWKNEPVEHRVSVPIGEWRDLTTRAQIVEVRDGVIQPLTTKTNWSMLNQGKPA